MKPVCLKQMFRIFTELKKKGVVKNLPQFSTDWLLSCPTHANSLKSLEKAPSFEVMLSLISLLNERGFGDLGTELHVEMMKYLEERIARKLAGFRRTRTMTKKRRKKNDL